MQNRLIWWLSQIVQQYPRMGRVIFTLYRAQISRYTLGAVGLIVNESQQVLLVEHRFHPHTPWGLPGGLVEGGESPQECVEREIKEELNLDVIATKPLSISPSKVWRRHMDVVYRVELQGSATDEQIELSAELSDWQWVDLLHLPEGLHPFTKSIIESEIGIGQNLPTSQVQE